MKTLLLLSSLAISLTACATLEPEECLRADWNSIGYTDALKGKTVLLADHRQACASVKVQPDQNAYMQGYNKGSQQFCTYESGLKVGQDGNSVSDICDKPGLSKAFYRGYGQGKKVYDKQQEIEGKEQERQEIEKKLTDIKLGKPNTSPAELDILYREKELLNKEIHLLEQELDDIQDTHSHYQHRN